MRIVALTITFALVGCAAPGPASTGSIQSAMTRIDSTPATLTPVQIQIVQQGLKRKLKDPESARFGAIGATRSDRDPNAFFVCGYVNAKNSYGGYGGMMPFIGGMAPDDQNIPLFVVTDIASNAGEARIAEELCHNRYGVNLVELADAR